MKPTEIELSLGIRTYAKGPVIESRARLVGRGKVLVMRTPILPLWATDEEVAAGTERILVDEPGI